MWFDESDPISAHTLAYAAFNVIDDVTKARNPNRAGLLFDAPGLSRSDRDSLNTFYRKG